MKTQARDALPITGAAASPMTTSAHRMPFGAEMLPGAGVRLAIWAPGQERIAVAVDGETEPQSLLPRGEGWHALDRADLAAGARYRFVLADGTRIPDPASRFQPQDIKGPSEIVDPTAYAWNDTGWRGKPLEECIFYELHVGSFSPTGSYRGVIDKLDHLVSLGITAIELMPIADFPGERNWGYDGVLPYAPDASYGAPDDLKALVDAAHAEGLMVFLDVVYNHFGPEGNFLPAYAPGFFTDRHKTPWGNAINYDGRESTPVRDFIIHNALYWLEEYHFDGLRLDAVHAIRDDSGQHLLEELAERAHRLAKALDRQIHLVLENDANQARFLTRDEGGAQPRWYAAQWDDDLHHCLHTAATGESGGYYEAYANSPEKLGRALAQGFVFQGEPSPFHEGENRGEPSGHLPPSAFISFVQNHDQIGNRAFGERLNQIAPAEAVRAIVAIYLMAPQLPMLFMGEEWGASSPFPFFCDFAEELANAVREGRRNEFAKFPEFSDPAARERIPDPVAPATFELARLDWAELAQEDHRGWLAFYRDLLALRRREIVPLLAEIRGGAGSYAVAAGVLTVKWSIAGGDTLVLVTNLSDAPATLPASATPNSRVLYTLGHLDPATRRIDKWSVHWFVEARP